MELKSYEKIISTRFEATVDNQVKRNNVGPRNISEFFTYQGRSLCIPPYQRPYSWTYENIKDLLEDIQKAKLKSQTWYLGSVFVTKEKESKNTINLLDGQQRITTLQLIIWNLSVIHMHYKLLVDSTLKNKFKKSNIEKFKLFNQLGLKLNTLLIDIESNTRFQMRDELSKVWRLLITSISDGRCDDYKSVETYLKKDFKNVLAKEEQKGFPSAKTLGESNKYIFDFYNKKFIQETISIETIVGFIDYCNVLLNDFWLIEIELLEDKDSLKIFEGLNNRGKSLSLTDKLRYKCLIALDKNEHIETIRDQWKEAYVYLNKIIDSGYYSDENDFFSYFLISISGEDLKTERKRIEFFEKTFLNDFTDVKTFCSQMLKVLKHFAHYDTFNSQEFRRKSNFKFLDETNKDKNLIYAQSLYSTLRRTLYCSKNIRFLLIKHILNSDFEDPNNVDEDYFKGVYNLIKVVIYFEIIKNRKSNNTRNLYLKISERSHSSKSLIPRLYESLMNNSSSYNLDKTDINYNKQDLFYNVVCCDNRSKANLIFYFISYNIEPTALLNQVQQYKNDCELEHILPKKWKTHWQSSKYEKNDVITYIKSHNLEYISLDIIASLGAEIELDEKSKEHPPHSLGEWIGNKNTLHKKVNTSISNLEFKLKADKLYADSGYIKIPTFQNKQIGIHQHQKFGYEEIISRSEKITDYLLKLIAVDEWTPKEL